MIDLQKKAKGIFTKEYKVSNYADRMGYRVEGEILNRAVEKRFYRVQLHMEPFKFKWRTADYINGR